MPPLKESKRQSKTLVPHHNAEAILSKLQRDDLIGSSLLLRSYLDPLRKLEDSSDKENGRPAPKHSLAKAFVPFLAQLLKLCSSGLSKMAVKDEEEEWHAKATELFSCMEHALDGLERVRPWLIGSPFEIEMQRYWLVRGLMAWKRYKQALDQDILVFRRLTDHFKSSKVSRFPKDVEGPFMLPRPSQKGDTRPEFPPLLVGAVVDLVVCTGEIGRKDPALFDRVISLPHQLEPWLRQLDEDIADKQRILLFKGLQRCALSMLQQPSGLAFVVVETFCRQTLHHCAFSSMNNHLPKVARSICFRLSSYTSEYTMLALNICEDTLMKLSHMEKLQRLWNRHELLDLIEYYAQLCQATKETENGWTNICKIIQNMQQFSNSIVLLGGLYGAGLIFSTRACELLEQMDNGHSSSRMTSDFKLLHEVSKLLEGAVQGAQQFLFLHGSFSSQSVLNLEEDDDSDDRGNACTFKLHQGADQEENARQFMSIFRALDFVRRFCITFVQVEWDSLIGRASKFHHACPLNQLMRDILHLFYDFFRIGQKSNLSYEDGSVCKRRNQSHLLAATSALRISLILQDGTHKKNTAIIKEIILDPLVQLEEIRWLISSTYNMGVQLFNVQQRILACEPLKIAYEACWIRVERLCSGSYRQKGDSSVADTNLAQAVAEACAKSTVYLDALSENSNEEALLHFFNDTLQRWARVVSSSIKEANPFLLVKLWLKVQKINADKSNTKLGEYISQGRILYFALRSLDPPLSPSTLGILLEEEYVFYGAMEELSPSDSLCIKRTILGILLDNVYLNNQFPLQHSKALLEKARLCRSNDYNGLSSCLADLSKAISSLKDALKISNEDSDNEGETFCVKYQLAIILCIRAVCSQEENPCSEEFLNDIVSALALWEDLVFLRKKASQEQLELCGAFPIEAIRVLQSTMDLVALKGYSEVYCKFHQLILELACDTHERLEEVIALIWADSKFTHVLCCQHFMDGFLTIATQKLGASVDSFEFWKSCGKVCAGSILDMWQEATSQYLLGEKGKEDNADSLDCSNWRKTLNDLKVPNTILEAIRLSEAYYMVAKDASNEGNMQEALRNAKEGLYLRLKVLNRHFKFLNTSCTKIGLPQAINTNETFHVEVLASCATSNWPSYVKSKKCHDMPPSHWRMIGDYIESLMQVGYLYEIMGAADDAEWNFREGYQISKYLNLSLASLFFTSSLGEVYRKRQMWEFAEGCYKTAVELLKHQEMDYICSRCKHMGEAVLDCRMGDLVRRRSDKMLGSQEILSSALNLYISAEHRICSFFLEGSAISDARNSIGCSCDKHGFAQSEKGLLQGQAVVDPSAVAEYSRGQVFKIRVDAGGIETLCKEMQGVIIQKDSNKNTCNKKQKPCLSKEPAGKHKVRSDNKDKCTVDDLRYEFEHNIGSEIDLTTKKEVEKISNARSGLHSHQIKSRKYCSRSASKSFVSLIEDMQDTSSEALLRDHVNDKLASIRNLKLTKQTVKRAGHAGQSKVSDEKGITKACWCQYLKKRLTKPCSMNQWVSLTNNHYATHLLTVNLVQQGKILLFNGRFHEAYKVFHHTVSLLHSCECGADCLEIMLKCLVDNTSVKRLSSCYPAEEGCLLYYLSILGLGQKCGLITTDECGCLSSMQVSEFFRWLSFAFSLCSEIPSIQRKVAGLLAILHVPRVSGGPSTLSIDEDFQCSKLAAYFHQASVGAAMRQQHLSILNMKATSSASMMTMKSDIIRFKACLEKTKQALRIVAKDPCEIEHIMNEVLKLPCSTICMSLVDQNYYFLFKDLDGFEQKAEENLAWLFITRFDQDAEPVVIVLPFCPSFERNPLNETLNPYSLHNQHTNMSDDYDKSFQKRSYISSSSDVNKNVVGTLGSILEESHQSTSDIHEIKTLEDKSRWWRWRTNLDSRLSSFLSLIENSWLGPWKCVLLGEYPGSAKTFREHAEKLKRILEKLSKKRVSLDNNLVRLLLQGTGSLSRAELEKGVGWLLGVKKPVEDGTDQYLYVDRSCMDPENELICRGVKAFVSTFGDVMKAVGLGAKLLTEDLPLNSVKREFSDVPVPRNLSVDFENADKVEVQREPIELVLDGTLQVLPWESLQVLGKHEVYRMPSVSSIRALMIQHQSLDEMEADQSNPCKSVSSDSCQGSCSQDCGPKSNRIWHLKERTLQSSTFKIPSVDPFKAYYLLNPSGDLASTQTAFEAWFRNQQGWKGKVGEIPTKQEYMLGLQENDLFLYFGHGSGDQYFSERSVRTMDRCAVSLLMGCSSGRLSPRGDYEPVGVPLSYLMGGCPAAIANLWDVTDGDIDRFSRILLEKWMSPIPKANIQLDSSSEETVARRKKSSNRSRGKKWKTAVRSQHMKHLLETDSSVPNPFRVASFIGEGRNSCRLTYLVGASPVCYGVPTVIRRVPT